MSDQVIETDFVSPSRRLGGEIRAELARAGRSQRWLAAQLHVNQTWVSRRISPLAESEVSLEDVVRIAKALGVSAQRLLIAATSVEGGDLLPRLDSNQQPSDYPYLLVSGGWDDPDDRVQCRCGGWHPTDTKCPFCPDAWDGAQVIDLDVWRSRVAS